MEYQFEELSDKINSAKSEEQLEFIINEWKININKQKYWINNIYSDNINLIDINKMPKVLEILYKTNDKFKFIIFCMLLEATIFKLPYITNLENIPIFVEKWKLLKNTLSVLVRKYESEITDCLFLILLNTDPKGEYFTEIERKDVIDGINKNLTDIYNYIQKGTNINKNVYLSLEVIFDVSAYLNNEETINLLKQFNSIDIPSQTSIFFVKTLLVNEISSCHAIINKLLSNNQSAYKLLSCLEKIDKLNIIKEKITQEKIAIELMNNWLCYPTELGKLPTNIKFVDKLEDTEGCIFYIFKFTTDNEKLSSRGYMLGISGGFKKGKLTTQNTGFTFSKFETIKEYCYKKQAQDILDMMANYWKNMYQKREERKQNNTEISDNKTNINW